MSDNLLIQDAINNIEIADIPQEYSSTVYPFRPVKCLESDIKNLRPVNNFLYFTTDTKRMYLGTPTEFLPMCASTGFFYGKKDIKYVNNGFEPDPNVTFYPIEIEGDAIPEKDDLILNKDGCFYRVITASNYLIQTKRLTLQGSGPGGGSSSGGGSTPSSGWGLRVITSQVVVASNSKTIPVSFEGVYNATAINNIKSVSFALSETPTEFFYVQTKELEFNTVHTIDLSPWRKLFSAASTDVNITVTDVFNTSYTDVITVSLIENSLIATQPTLIYSLASSYIYACKGTGQSKNVYSKEIRYTFYDERNMQEPVIPPIVRNIEANQENISTPLDVSRLSHGIYTLVVESILTLTNGTVIHSNQLVHKFAMYSMSENIPLLMIHLPTETEQYTNTKLDYLLVYPNNSNSYNLNIRSNNKAIASLSVNANVAGSYDLYYETNEVQSVVCEISSLGLVHTSLLTVNKYTGNLPIINGNNLMLHLNPKGMSNDAVNKNAWLDATESYTANITNCQFGGKDGWQTDEEGAACLRLTSGAKLTLDDFHPFQEDPTKISSGDNRMGYGMTIEVDFTVSGTLDYDTELIRCVSTNMLGEYPVGFVIRGDKILFYNSRKNGLENGPLMSVTYVEGKRTRASFVIEPNSGLEEYPMSYIYLNGILSNAVIYDSTDAFVDASYSPATLQIDSSDAQITIYGIRFYHSYLTPREAVNNYIATMPSLAEKEAMYNDNNVTDTNGRVDFTMVASSDYDIQIPYMTITGGWQTVGKDDKWRLKEQTAAQGAENNPGLPTGKEDYRLVDIEVKYPKNNTYFAKYKNYKFKNTFASGSTMAEAYEETPSNGGCIMYAQGTSSMEYPVKNLRLRFKKEANWFEVKPGVDTVEIICMKADYMESSGSHNTGAANFIDSLYKNNQFRTPGQAEFSKADREIVTCIKGHPCLIFYRPDENSTYEYIGKYNLNLDKATPEPFGFMRNPDTGFGFLDVGEPYYAVKYYDKNDENSSTWIGQEEPDEGGDYYPGQEETLVEVAEPNKINAIHCFEFLDNTVEVCNFVNKAKAYIKDPVTGEMVPDPNGGFYTFEETWYGTYMNSKNKPVPGWTLGFESRYPEDKVGYHDADALWPLASWLNDLYCLRYGLYHHEGEANEAEALRRFKEEYELYLDREFTLTYYLVTEALLMADSRVKNMMIATWGKEKRTLNGQEYNNYIFYPIFYDMDTMLGLDNTGVYRFNYYDEDTDSSIYNGRCILWTFVRDALGDELASFFSSLEQNGLKAQNILPYFNLNQANMANESFYNGDAEYKYLAPAREGYIDHLHGKQIDPGVGPYLYAAQGDRTLLREWFLNNRMKFLRGKYRSSDYLNGDRIDFRWYCPSKTDPDSTIAASANAVEPDGRFTFTSLKTGYAGVLLGANSVVYNSRFDGEEEQTIVLPATDDANGTEAYIVGLSTLTDVGDLSNKYMQKFIISSQDVRLQHLTLGNPHKNYHNPYWSTTVDGQSPTISVQNCRYLRTFNLQNCRAYKGTLNFSNCNAIEKILLTGSGTTGITLPTNGHITELRLPPTISNLSIKSHPLTADMFSMGTYDYGTDAWRIGDPGGRYVSDYGSLSTLEVVDTDIDTYSIVKNAKNLEYYNLQGISWVVDDDNDYFYCAVSNNDQLAFGECEYYTYNIGTQTYELYEGNSYPSSGKLYEKKSILTNGVITHIPVLEYLKTKRVINNTGYSTGISGTIHIDVNGHADEFGLFEKYNGDFPKVTISYGTKVELDKAYVINFYNQPKTEGVDLMPYYSVLSNGTIPWNVLLSADGPAKVALENPVKASTLEHEFEFSGTWHNEGNEDEPYTNLLTETSNPPDKDLNLYPHFTRTDRVYSVVFHDDNDGVIFTESFTYSTETTIEQVMEGYPLYFHYKPYTGGSANTRYALKGWISEYDFVNKVKNPTPIDLSKAVANGSKSYYPYYAEENVLTTPTDVRCFELETNETHQCKLNGISLTTLKIKPQYRPVLEGAITLPATFNGLEVEGFIGVDGQVNENALNLYFQQGNKYLMIGNYAFYNFSNMTAIELPLTLKAIGKNSFIGTHITNINIDKLSSLEAIGEAAFKSDSIKKIYTTTSIKALPNSVKSIGTNAFTSNSGVTISELPSSLMFIGGWAFNQCGGISITKINDGNFENYRMEQGVFSNAAQEGLNSQTVNFYINATSLTKFDQTASYSQSKNMGPFYRYGNSGKNPVVLWMPVGASPDNYKDNSCYIPVEYSEETTKYLKRSEVAVNNQYEFKEVICNTPGEYNEHFSKENPAYLKISGISTYGLQVSKIEWRTS